MNRSSSYAAAVVLLCGLLLCLAAQPVEAAELRSWSYCQGYGAGGTSSENPGLNEPARTFRQVLQNSRRSERTLAMNFEVLRSPVQFLQPGRDLEQIRTGCAN